MKIKLNGKDLDLQPLTLNDWAEIEESFGGQLETILKNMSLKQIRHVIWRMIHKADPSFSEESIGQLLFVGTELYNNLTGMVFPEEIRNRPPTGRE